MVECFLAKEDVAGSTPVSRSNNLNLDHLRITSLELRTTVRCVLDCGFGAGFYAQGAVPKW